MISPQESIPSLASDSLTMQLLNEFISQQRTSRVQPTPLHPGDNFIMPMPEDSADAGPNVYRQLDGELTRVLTHNFFTSKDSTLRTDLPYRSYGVAGDPVPYTVRGDNAIAILLILCFLFFVVSVAHSKRFIIKQIKGFFFVTR